ncbi:ATP-binding protein [Microbispora bryophytorum]|uniref:ATP-binding protein n=1 Tax=Microbispora bryophytorum TaxID=1460882 RepID=UPI0033C5188D
MRNDDATTGLIGAELINAGLIGREHPAAVLHAEIARAVGSHGGLTLVAGEAGIGKTTLVTSAAEEARRLGALVLSGSCWDSDNAPGYRVAGRCSGLRAGGGGPRGRAVKA